MMSADQNRVRLTYCYAQEDTQFLQELEKHLKPFKNAGQLETLSDHHILPGDVRQQKRAAQLNTATLIVLLISAHFLSSDNCNEEMRQALARCTSEQVQIVPILVRSVDLQQTPLAGRRLLPADDKPISSWRNRDEAWKQIASNIGQLISMQLGQLCALNERTPKSQPLLYHQTLHEYQAPQRESIRHAFARQRQLTEEPSRLVNAPIKRNFHEEIIISYDLDQAMGNFRAELIYGQAAGFIMASDFYLLSSYILKRALLEFKGKIQGDCFKDELHLHQADLHSGITLSRLIKEKILHYYNYAHLKELVKKRPKQHIMLTIWNHDLPLNMLREAVTSFWQEWVPVISPYLQKKLLCFALILAHLPPEKDVGSIDGFTTIQLPTDSEMRKNVSSWVARKLDEFPVPSTRKRGYLAQFNEPHASCIQILRCLENIAESLQGMYSQDRYQESSQSLRKRIT